MHGNGIILSWILIQYNDIHNTGTVDHVMYPVSLLEFVDIRGDYTPGSMDELGALAGTNRPTMQPTDAVTTKPTKKVDGKDSKCRNISNFWWHIVFQSLVFFPHSASFFRCLLTHTISISYRTTSGKRQRRRWWWWRWRYVLYDIIYIWNSCSFRIIHYCVCFLLLLCISFSCYTFFPTPCCSI